MTTGNWAKGHKGFTARLDGSTAPTGTTDLPETAADTTRLTMPGVAALYIRFGHQISKVSQVRQFARDAHNGQLDKMGRDYYNAHLAPIAAALAEHGEHAEMAGLLHDIIEDTSVTSDQLLSLGVPAPVVRAVEAVSRRVGESYTNLIARACADPLGRLVKLADNAQNLAGNDELADVDPATAARLKTRYLKARQTLLAAGIKAGPE